MEKLKIAVIQGTTREKRESIKVSKLIVEVGNSIEDVEAILVDPTEFDLPFDGNDTEAKDPEYTKITEEADAFFIVIPEYNHTYPGSLKRLLDSEFDNYIHKPVAFAGVSSGQWGGVRAIESIITAIRQMGMTITFTDVQFPNVGKLFDENGKLLNDKYIDRVERVYSELIWMAKAMRWARENLSSTYHNT